MGDHRVLNAQPQITHIFLILCVLTFGIAPGYSHGDLICTMEGKSYAERLEAYASTHTDCLRKLPTSKKMAIEQHRVLSSVGSIESEGARKLAILAITEYFDSHRDANFKGAIPLVSAAKSQGEGELEFNANRWVVGANGTLYEALVNPFLNACSQTSESCDTEFVSVRDSLAFIDRVKTLTDSKSASVLKGELSKMDRRIAYWDAYLDEQQFQYFWELSTNYCMDYPDFSRLEKLQCFVPILAGLKAQRARDKAPQQGWGEIPTTRWIFLHPEIGIAVSQGEEDGSEVQPSLIFEWIGIKRWKWNGDWKKDTDSAYACRWGLCPIGMSIVSQYADLASHKDLGHGASVHFKNFAISATHHEGERGGSEDWVISLNLNLSKLFLNNGGNTKAALRSVFIEKSE